MYNDGSKRFHSILPHCHPSQFLSVYHHDSWQNLTEAGYSSIGFKVITKSNYKVNLKCNEMHGYYDAV